LDPTRLLQTIAHLQQADIQIVGIAQSSIELLLLTKAGADVVVLEALQAPSLPSICTHLLSEFPDVRIVVVSTDGDETMVYWLGLRQQRMSQSVLRLSDIVRQAYALDPLASS
ncbi:MAG: hypothetical protein KAX40_00095, partial [Herpetosiphon sp.]|nr:hypothetical protein [Herpetosiphon sp.]